jgi:hypothetical protein
MEDNLDKQLVPYMEHVIDQTLNMIELVSKEESFDKKEINKLIFELKSEFGDYLTLLSPQIQGRIMEINHYILDNNKVYEESNDQPNTQPFEDNAKE